MTRPEMVRADTLDLQDPVSPSAKDHSRQPASPKALGDGPPAPHQAQSLRKASLDGYDLNVRSPRGSKDLSDKELQLLHEGEDHDGLGDGGHGHGGEHDPADSDAGIDEEDDDLDDDLMDKISSSPSIDDGGYNTSQSAWPRRGDSLMHRPSPVHRGAGLSGVVRTASPESPSAGDELADPQPSERSRRRGDVSPKESSTAATTSEQEERVGGGGRQSVGTSRFKENLKILDSLFGDATAASMRRRIGREIRLPGGDRAQASELESGAMGEDVDSAGVEDSDSEHSSATPPSVDDEDPELWADERFIDSGWGGECLREVEDIDFEFVYALHTFVATVEGQANATKGDTMVLLDDSNSYWWLVKVVKDSSIGYLPAEHIETPTERLARLNKHRNIDVGHPSDIEDEDFESNATQLSQTMLGDTAAKKGNPITKAIRRRNVKTVQFTDPIYYEPSEPSYSSDEEEDDLMSPSAHEQAQQAQQQHQNQQREAHGDEESDIVEPLRTSRGRAGDEAMRDADSGTTLTADSEKSRTSQDTLDSSEDGVTGRRMRNTDSFYKDDSLGTKKISLTPGLLQDESSKSVVEESRASMDSEKSNEKTSSKDEKPKKEKKEKKGMLGGLFKRKNSKSKSEKEEEKEEANKMSPQNSNDPAVRDSTSTVATSSPQSQKQGKLQKSPPAKAGPGSKRGQIPEETVDSKLGKQDGLAIDVSRQDADDAAMSPEPLRQARPGAPAPLSIVLPENKGETESRSGPSKGGILSPIQAVLPILSSSSGNSEPKEPKPEKVKKAKNRMALEDSDASEDEGPTAAAIAPAQQQTQAPYDYRPAPHPLEITRAVNKPERLSESPIEVSPVASSNHLAPSSSQLDVPPSPVSAVSTPELVERPHDAEAARSVNNKAVAATATGAAAAAAAAAGAAPALRSAFASGQTPSHHAVATKTPDANATPSTSTMSSPVTAPTTPQWSPAALRAYLEADGAHDVRDLMLLVHDTSDVKELPQGHDLMRAFDGERRRLDGMQRKLDGLLDEILSRTTTPTSAF